MEITKLLSEILRFVLINYSTLVFHNLFSEYLWQVVASQRETLQALIDHGRRPRYHLRKNLLSEYCLKCFFLSRAFDFVILFPKFNHNVSLIDATDRSTP